MIWYLNQKDKNQPLKKNHSTKKSAYQSSDIFYIAIDSIVIWVSVSGVDNTAPGANLETGQVLSNTNIRLKEHCHGLVMYWRKSRFDHNSVVDITTLQFASTKLQQ